MQAPQRAIGVGLAEGVIDALREPDGVLPVGETLPKLANLREAPRQPAPRQHRGEARQPEALPERVVVEGRDRPAEQADGLSIVPTEVVDLGEIEARHNPEPDLPERLGQADGSRPPLHRPIGIAGQPEGVCRVRDDPSESRWVIEGLGESLRLLELARHLLGRPQRNQGVGEINPDVDRLREPLTILGQVADGLPGLLEHRQGFAVGRAPQRLRPGQTEVPHGLVPHLALAIVTAQRRVPALQLSRVQRVEGLGHAAMEQPGSGREDLPRRGGTDRVVAELEAFAHAAQDLSPHQLLDALRGIGVA